MLVELQFTVMRCYANSAPQTSWLDFGERKGRGNGRRKGKGEGERRGERKGRKKKGSKGRKGGGRGRKEENGKVRRKSEFVCSCDFSAKTLLHNVSPTCALRLSPVALYAVINRFIDDMFSYIFHLILTAMPSVLLPSVL